jgi:glycosyltransferase involved in cell wall biosynthesis
MKPLVSILIPAYNDEMTLVETLDSAVGQTWPRKEIIVVDDGSTDRTLAVARRYSNVIVVSQSNQGASTARNKALSVSKGDYIQWLDADDVLAVDKIAKQMEAVDHCRNKRMLLSAQWAAFMFRRHNAKFTPTSLWADLTPIEWLLRKMGENIHMQTATWLVSRELTEAAGLWNPELTVDDDGEYFCRVLLQSDGVKFVPESKVYYRKPGPGSLSYLGGSSHKIEAQYHSMCLQISSLLSCEDSERVRRACVIFLQNWSPEFYPERPDIIERAAALAEDLGGKLEIPSFTSKYSWIGIIGGPRMAKRVQVAARGLKLSMSRSWDRALWFAERYRSSDGT